MLIEGLELKIRYYRGAQVRVEHRRTRLGNGGTTRQPRERRRGYEERKVLVGYQNHESRGRFSLGTVRQRRGRFHARPVQDAAAETARERSLSDHGGTDAGVRRRPMARVVGPAVFGRQAAVPRGRYVRAPKRGLPAAAGAVLPARGAVRVGRARPILTRRAPLAGHGRDTAAGGPASLVSRVGGRVVRRTGCGPGVQPSVVHQTRGRPYTVQRYRRLRCLHCLRRRHRRRRVGRM